MQRYWSSFQDIEIAHPGLYRKIPYPKSGWGWGCKNSKIVPLIPSSLLQKIYHKTHKWQKINKSAPTASGPGTPKSGPGLQSLKIFLPFLQLTMKGFIQSALSSKLGSQEIWRDIVVHRIFNKNLLTTRLQIYFYMTFFKRSFPQRMKFSREGNMSILSEVDIYMQLQLQKMCMRLQF